MIELTSEEYCCAVYHGIYLRQISIFDGRRDNVSVRDLEKEKERIDKTLDRLETCRTTGQFTKDDLLPDYVFRSNNGLRIQIIGAITELAGAKFAGTAWHRSPNRFKKADCANNLEIRLIGNENYDLRVKPNDKNHFRVLAILIPPGTEKDAYKVIGWITAEEGKKFPIRDPNWSYRPFYSVPQKDLASPESLLQLLESEGRENIYISPTLDEMFENTLESYIQSKAPPTIDCEHCKQPAGSWCITKTGKRAKTHSVRKQ
jgi:hypothetical protein